MDKTSCYLLENKCNNLQVCDDTGHPPKHLDFR